VSCIISWYLSLEEGRWYFHITNQVYLGHFEEVQNVELQASDNSFGSWLNLYKYDDSNSVDITLYRQLVGILIYLTTTQHL